MIRHRAQQRQARQNAVACGEHAHQRRGQLHVRWRHQQADSRPAAQFEVGRKRRADFRYGRVVDRDLRDTARRATAGTPCSTASRPSSTTSPTRKIARSGRSPRARPGAPAAASETATAGRSSTQFSAPKFEIAPSKDLPIRPSSSALQTVAVIPARPRHAHHGGGGVRGIHMDAARREMRGILAGAAADIENPVARMEEPVDCAPHQIPLGAADRGVVHSAS